MRQSAPWQAQPAGAERLLFVLQQGLPVQDVAVVVAAVQAVAVAEVGASQAEAVQAAAVQEVAVHCQAVAASLVLVTCGATTKIPCKRCTK